MKRVRASQRRVRARAALSVGAALTAAVALTACSSASSARSGNVQPKTAAQKECVTKAQQLITKYKASPKLALGPKIDASSLKGRSVWVINEDESVPVMAGIEQGVDNAAQVAGMSVKNFDGQGTAALASQGMKTAIAARPAGIVIDSIQAKLIAPELAAAKAAHIPVVSVYEAEDVPGTIFGTINLNFQSVGQSAAAEALVTTGCNLNEVFFHTPVYSAQTQMYDEMASTVKSLCPACEPIAEDDYDPTTVATAVAPEALNYVHSHPSLNVLMAGTDDIGEFIAPALANAHSTVKLLSTSGVPADIGYVRSGTQLADVANPNNTATGWAAADQLFRGILGKPAFAGDQIASRLITKANVGSAGSDLFPTYANLENAYKGDWGIK